MDETDKKRFDNTLLLCCILTGMGGMLETVYYIWIGDSRAMATFGISCIGWFVGYIHSHL